MNKKHIGVEAILRRGYGQLRKSEWIFQLTNPWSRVPLDQPVFVPLVKQLWNTKISFRIRKSLPLASVSDQSTSSYPISVRPILVLFSHLRLGPRSGFYPSGFPTKILSTRGCIRKFPD